MKILTYSTLYPSSARPSHGVFVENRLRHLTASGLVAARVVAPVPWFPFGDPRFGARAAFARTPRREDRFGIPVVHPRYLAIPKIGMTVSPALLYAGSVRAARRILAEGFDFGLIDAHYFYPDGVAAAMLARALKKPFVVTARGTDVNLIPRYALPKRMILWAARNASAIVTVCDALKDSLIGLGVPEGKIATLRNGVDLKTFHPVDRAAARARLGVSGVMLLSVGHLIPRKGHDFVLRALTEIPQARLFIAGEGPEEQKLQQLARDLGVADRVVFTGRIDHAAMADYYGAADVLVLASDREGWANVLLESMACGTPVVATRIWGTPEVVASPEAGLLVDERSGPAIAAGIRRILASPPDRTATRAYAEKFSWDATTEGQIQIFRSILEQRAR